MKPRPYSVDDIFKVKAIDTFTKLEFDLFLYLTLTRRLKPIFYETVGTKAFRLLYIKIDKEILSYVIQDDISYRTLIRKVRSDLKYINQFNSNPDGTRRSKRGKRDYDK